MFIILIYYKNSIDHGMFEAVDRRGVEDPGLACCPTVSHASEVNILLSLSFLFPTKLDTIVNNYLIQHHKENKQLSGPTKICIVVVCVNIYVYHYLNLYNVYY